jgi:hypothetical protein
MNQTAVKTASIRQNHSAIRIRKIPSNRRPSGQSSPSSGTHVREIAEYLTQFDSRHAAAEYSRGYADWLQKLMVTDTVADYYPFALNSTLPIATNRNERQFLAALCKACERATVTLFPTFSRSHPERHDPSSSVLIIVIPAISASGAVHYHGWIRIPNAASQVLQPVAIHTNGRRHHIDAPEALGVVVRALMDDTDAPFRPHQKYVTSLWVQHLEGLAVPSGRWFPAYELAYLRNTADGELRLWTECSWVPDLVFSRLNIPSNRTRNVAPTQETPTMPKRQNAARFTTLTVFRTPPHLVDALAVRAKQQGKTVSALIRDLLLAGLAREDGHTAIIETGKAA